MWEKDININDVKEIRVKTTAYLGVGAITKIDSILEEMKNKGHKSVILVTGKNSYKSSGSWAHVQPALEKHGFTYKVYDKITPNPNNLDVDEATEMAKSINADLVIGIGGGSPIDASKSVAILLKYQDKNAEDLYELKFTPTDAAPVVAINLTHGTGTEVDRFAVVSIPSKEFKPAIAYDCIYPAYAIDDPALMVSLGKDQSTYVSIDAINHIVEASTTNVANPLSILTAQETVRLVSKYLPILREDLSNMEARYYLTYAALIAGTSFDNGLLHMTHALEHPLSAVKTDLTHGLGLAILLPAVIKNIFAARKETLLSVFAPIFKDKEINDGEAAANAIREWLHSVGVTETLKDIGFAETDVEKLTNLAFDTPGLAGLLACSPVNADKEMVASVYRDSL